MTQTKEGAAKAAKKIKEEYGDDFFKRIGAMGGKTPTRKPKGFAANPALAREVGKRGGRKSRRYATSND